MTPPPHIIQFAVESAMESRCQSKRGAAIFNRESLISTGFNYQPSPFGCDSSDSCRRSCSRTAVHAEQAALIGVNARGFEMLHVKIEGSNLVASGPPSCIYCSKIMLAAGITHMWLYHEGGWQRYLMSEFHWRSSVGTDYIKRYAIEMEGRS